MKDEIWKGNLPACDKVDPDGVDVGSVGAGQIGSVGRFQFHRVSWSTDVTPNALMNDAEITGR